MKKDKPYLSVVIPAYNEEINIERGVLNSVYDYLKRQKYSWEVLIVDDGSTDKTLSRVRAFAKRRINIEVMAEPHRGKGGTVIAGMLAAKGEVVLFTDMDQATPISQVGKLLSRFDEGNDIVIGSRAGRKGAPLIRKIMAYGFMALRAVILRLPFKDTQCGFKVFKRTAAQKVFKKMKVFDENSRTEGASVTAGFDVEVLYIARKMGMKVSEVSVEWYEYGERKAVSPIKDSWEGLRDMLKVRWNATRGMYK